VTPVAAIWQVFRQVDWPRRVLKRPMAPGTL